MPTLERKTGGLNFGIVLCETAGRMWQLACVRELEEIQEVRLRTVIHRPAAEASPRHARLCSSLGLASQMPVDVHQFMRGRQCAFSDADDVELDFLLLFGNVENAVDLIRTAKYGLWYFRHGDLPQFATKAPGFWEIYHDHAVVGTMLLKAQSREVAGIPLKKAFFPTTRDSFGRNVETVFKELSRWPAQLSLELLHGIGPDFDADPIIQPLMEYGDPTQVEIATLKLLTLKNRLGKHVQNYFFRLDWHIGRLKGLPSDFIDHEAKAEVEFLDEKVPGSFLADPCILRKDNKIYLLCEEYPYGTKRGMLVASEISSAGTRPQPVLAEPYHLSYPHVFEHEGEIFLIPSAEAVKKISLYRAIEFPYRWEYVHTLIDGFSASDSTLVRFSDKWWLFCSSDERACLGSNFYLYIWYADDLWSEWTPHPKNPVKIDARSSRPAGKLFMHGGALYRPAQDCSRSYGGAIRINRIGVLTESDFEERPVGTIKPPAPPYDKGIHTISIDQDVCVTDALRYVFYPAGIVDVVKRVLQHARRGRGRTQSLRPAPSRTA